jgi:hypothetical protein
MQRAKSTSSDRRLSAVIYFMKTGAKSNDHEIRISREIASSRTSAKSSLSSKLGKISLERVHDLQNVVAEFGCSPHRDRVVQLLMKVFDFFFQAQ